MDDRERSLYVFFLDKKNNAKFDGTAKFCIVNPKTMIFNPYDNHALKATMREDPKGALFANFYFRGIPGILHIHNVLT